MKSAADQRRQQQEDEARQRERERERDRKITHLQSKISDSIIREFHGDEDMGELLYMIK